ncbi:putative WD repeat-containing protein [Morus notabilis]|uniref:Putative WD repeat-containing protein n=1 Tax=Morus notabilis TaxID=981085 RepID=W9SB55_9ROSA|nr:protein JINGUBANG [Morus notabilis]EXC34223.1 putative WD repeat-containing protein [Morus notabilis]
MGIMERHQTFYDHYYSQQQQNGLIPPHHLLQPPDHDDLDHDHQPADPLYLSSQRSLQSVASLTSSKSHHQNHLHQYCLISSFTPHSSYVSSIAVAENLVFTGSSDREIASWNNHINNNHHNNNNVVLTAGNGAVKSLVVSGDKLFSAHQDHKIRVWRISSSSSNNNNSNNNNNNNKYTRLATLPTLGDRAAKLLMPGNHVTIRRHKKSTWVHHVDAVSGLALSPDESLLYSVSWDRTLKVWQTTDFKCLESVHNAHDDAINAVAASSDGHVYTGSTDSKIKVWKRNLGDKKLSLVATLEKHKSGINALAISSDGTVLYSGASDRSVVVWERKDIGEGKNDMVVLGALRGHSKAILCLSVVSDLVCSGSADKTVRVWRGVERSYSCLAVFEGHTGPVKCLTAVIDDRSCDDDHDVSCLVYSGGLDCEVKVWQIIVPNLL